MPGDPVFPIGPISPYRREQQCQYHKLKHSEETQEDCCIKTHHLPFWTRGATSAWLTLIKNISIKINKYNFKLYNNLKHGRTRFCHCPQTVETCVRDITTTSLITSCNLFILHDHTVYLIRTILRSNSPESLEVHVGLSLLLILTVPVRDDIRFNNYTSTLILHLLSISELYIICGRHTWGPLRPRAPFGPWAPCTEQRWNIHLHTWFVLKWFKGIWWSLPIWTHLKPINSRWPYTTCGPGCTLEEFPM